VSLPSNAALHPDRPDELAAGAAALRDGRIADAVAAYDRALERLSVDGQPEQRGAALLARGLAQQLLGETSNATADVLAALNAWSLARADWASSAMSDLAAALSGAGNLAADTYWQAALRLAERSGDVILQAAVAGEWGRHAARAGEAVTAVALLEKSAELGRRAGDDAIVAKALVNLARVELDAGRGGHAMRNIGEALARDQRGDLRAATAGLLIDVAAGAFHSGDTAHAELCLEQALSLSGSDRQIRERTLAALGGLARARNDYVTAARYGEELLDSARRGGDLTVAAESLHDLGRIALLAGALDDAAQRLTESVVIARSLGLDSLAASGSRALAEVAVRRGSLLRALGYAEQAVILSMGQDDLEACAATLLLVAAEASRAGLEDVATPANAGAAEIYRLLERDDLAQVLTGSSQATGPGAEARTDRLEAGLEAARSVVDPNGAGDLS
jgi:tetratricopeptide (TPR) repeat protein